MGCRVIKRIGELGEVVGGATPSTKNPSFWGGSIPWISPKDLTNYGSRYIARGAKSITEEGLAGCSAKMLPAGSVLFSSRAPIGYVAIAKCSVCTNQGFKSVIPSETTDSLFLYYLLRANAAKIAGLGSGTTFKEISGSTMRSISLEVPSSIDEQRAIAGILGSIDSKIELNTKLNGYLEKLLLTKYDELFPANADFTGILSDVGEVIGGATPSKKRPEYYSPLQSPFLSSKKHLRRKIESSPPFAMPCYLNSCQAKLMSQKLILRS